MYYILEDRKIVKVGDVLTWGRWFEHANRVVEQEFVSATKISTVFLGLDHQYDPNGPPLLFETMVFGGPLDGEQERCTTYAEAEAMHARMVGRVELAMMGKNR